MFTPVDDYMKVVKDDYNNLVKYLDDYYSNSIDSNIKESLRIIHKNIWIMQIWKRYANIQDKYFDDIILNYMSIIHSCIIKDCRVISFLTRGIIEDFIKYSKVFYNDIDQSSQPRDIFEVIFKDSAGDEYINNNYQIIKSVYSDKCVIVHGSQILDLDICEGLVAYESYYQSAEIIKNVNELDKAFRCINNILNIQFVDIFLRMNNTYQCIIRDYTHTKDLEALFKRIQTNKS